MTGLPCLMVAGLRIEAALRAGGWMAFRLAGPVRGVRLLSSRFRPADRAGTGDTRQLGFALTALRILADGEQRDFDITDPGLCDGFHPPDSGPPGTGSWRWTNGDAGLPDALFRGLAGRLLLVVQGFAEHGAPGGASHRAAFMSGDSYPRDSHVESLLFQGLHPFLADGLVRQADMLPPGGTSPDSAIDARLARLERATAGIDGKLVLFGRSSGARAATLFAPRPGLVAVVCLGYPFRAPGQPEEPARTAHLADLSTPTLIIQGSDDAYGAAEWAALACAMSSLVQLHVVACGHEFHLDVPQWAALSRRVLLFLAEAAAE
jgi:dienelactone hydrolase